VHVDHVRALNLVEIEFHGVDSAMTSWRIYMAHLNSETGILEGEKYVVFHDKARDLLAKLLAKMAKFLGFEMGEIDLRLGYTPSGWTFQESRQVELRESAIELFRGRVPLNVRPEQSPKSGAAE
jgi:hypothetical protein